jgi:prepilin signal peptidase PulO-like enzyme (type II secretory pathway)
VDLASVWPGAVLACVLGLIFGSFATMLAHRLAHGGDILGRRSACPSCGAVLTAQDLVPLLSWLVMRGRCRHCAAPIGWRYPATELACALAFLAAWWVSGGLGPGFAMLAGLAVALIAMSAVDLEQGWLPDPLQMVAALLAPAWRLTGDDPSAAALDMALGAAVLGGAGLAVRWGFRLLRGREGFGLGDVKLLAVAGLWLGLAPTPMFLVLGGGAGALLALIWRATGRGAEFPLGPALASALYLLLIFPALGGLLA